MLMGLGHEIRIALKWYGLTGKDLLGGKDSRI
jgi:hypothetical protein